MVESYNKKPQMFNKTGWTCGEHAVPLRDSYYHKKANIRWQDSAPRISRVHPFLHRAAMLALQALY